jgi:two-component system chemotaxis sensor kinase CheA
MNPMEAQFVAEARELVQTATEDLIAVEREGFDKTRIDRIFRAFHTLKGGAGVVDLPALGLVMHAAEDLLAAISKKQRPITPAIISEALDCLDQVSTWVADFEARGKLPANAGEVARKKTERMHALLTEGAHVAGSAERTGSASVEGAMPEWFAHALPAISSSTPAALWGIVYEPRQDCFFNGDDPLMLLRKLPGLLALNVEPRTPWPPTSEMDPYACNLRIQAIASGSREEFADVFRLVPDQVRFIELPSGEAAGEAVQPQTSVPKDFTDAVIREQQELLRFPVDEEHVAGRFGSIGRVVINALRHAGRADHSEEIDQAVAAAIQQCNAGPLSTVLASIAHVSSAEAGTSPSADPAGERGAAQSLRVDESKVNALFNLATEMMVTQNAFAYVTRRAQDVFGDHEIVRDLKREHDAMQRLISEMHLAALHLRMVPIARLFQALPRLVRDIALRLEKKATLSVKGETEECDKNIVDRLFEPLVHLVRNAIDHGIELPAERRSAGKPETGTISIEASRVGDRLIITVSDDGRGIDPAKIRSKARQKALLPPDELDKLPDEQVLQLVFAAGLSTATTISDISGRGVGMDAVRTGVEQMGGRLALSSTVGAGTDVRVDLPVSIAISRIMVVEAGGQVFGIPMDAVSETVRLTPDRISEIKGNEGFVLRDRVVPICSLAELMDLPKPPSPGSRARLLIVAEAGSRVVALEVDAIRDRLDSVIKPMQGMIADARSYIGTTLLGDGSVLLVLDLKEVLP